MFKKLGLFVFIVIAFSSLSYSQQDTSRNDTLRYLPYYFRGNPFKTNNYFNPKLQPFYNLNVNYDPGLGFIITNTFDSLSFGEPLILDFDQYLKQQNRQTFFQLWQKQLGSNVSSKNFSALSSLLSPNIKFGVTGADKIFGSNVISIRPTGSIGLTFGLSYNKIYNPSLPPELRGRYPTFVFDQDIQLGINGKIGDKVNVGINYNTNSMFDFQDQKRLEYTGGEDEIIQRLEAGNVMFTTENSLIQGSSTLFGLKSILKFGRLTVESVISQRKGQAKTVEVSGGAVLNDFEIRASDYDADQHFFLSQYFRDIYEQTLRNLPVVASPIKITKIEVWVTNKTSDFQNSRNIIAFQDLGEAQKIYNTGLVHPTPGQTYASNDANDLYQNLVNNYPQIRDITKASSILTGIGFDEGTDFIKLENARKLDPKDYTVNYDLGYISLNYPLKPGEILAVAFEYTMNGKVYKVGEFSTDVNSPDALILKLLRGPASVPNLPMWDLMMKNIYSLGTWNIQQQDFVLDIYYNDDRTGNMINYLPEGRIKNKPLLRVFNLDKADQQNNPYPDGFFDFLQGITIDPQHGWIIFPELEPFGSFLKKKIGDARIAEHYVYQELYDSTQYIAKQLATKNKFYLKGHLKSSSGAEIMLNAMNIPRGSVHVTQGGRELQENVDYTVDYNLGKVTIINKSLLMSGIPIKVTLESQDLYGMTTQNFVGAHFNYEFSKNFNVGLSYTHLTEMPIEIKTPFGTEPVSNTLWGMNTSYSSQLPFLTKLVDALPFIQTKAPSRIDFQAEFANLIPGNPRFLNKRGVSYVDDFENTQTYIDLKAPQAWVLASIPQHQPAKFPEASDITGRTSGYNRALLAWYDISTDFTNPRSTTRPDYITKDDISNHLVREIYETEIYPNRQPFSNTPARLTVLNLAFYPDERGPYNYDVQGEPGISAGINRNGTLKAPQTRWGGIMRDLYVTDFESSNIEFIQFWLMDPFVYDSTRTGGNLYIDLGDISEDILKDGRKSFENGIPYPDDPTKVDTTQWGIVSRQQMTTQNFSNDPAARHRQDAGFDGILDETEQNFFSDYLQNIAALYGTNSPAYLNAVNDPSDDDFRYFLDPVYDQEHASILERYKHYNGTEGNSPIAENNSTTYQAVTFKPDMEDINRDNTLDNYEAYYEYKIHLSPEDMKIGKNYIVNKVRAKVKLPNGQESEVTWYQFKIPVRKPDAVYGNISGFKSIRFMRLYLRGWSKPIVLRFGEFNLVREEWRQYQGPLLQGGEATSDDFDDKSRLDISVVNIEESSQKQPVNYVLPPGVTREQDPYNEQLRQLNEQSLALRVINLADGQAKAVYKLVDMDVRKYKKIKMFVHAEALAGQENQLHDNDLVLFIRLGSDFTKNYYEYDIPLKVTPPGYYYAPDNDVNNPNRYIVWPSENELNLAFQTLLDVKQKRNELMYQEGSNVSYNTPFTVYDHDRKITVLGNPNLSNVKVIMIGIRNPSRNTNTRPDDGLPKSGEIWVDELRLEDFNDQGGWAADARVNLTLADLGNINFSAYTHTPGFGSLEQRVNERYKDQTIQYDLSTRLQLGKFFPKKYGVSLPVYLGYSERISNPEYNPLDPDIKLRTALANPNLTPEQKDLIRHLSQTYVRRKSFNITNIRITGKQQRTTVRNIKKTTKGRGNSKRRGRSRRRVKPFYHISNFSASFAYNEIYQRSPIVNFNIRQDLMASFAYSYSPNPPNIKPFSKVKLFRKRIFALIRDFNFYYLPTRLNYSVEINRQFITYQARSLNPQADVILPVMSQKNFLWRKNFDFSYRLTQNLKLDFSSNTQARVEPQGWRDFSGNSWVRRIYNPHDTIFMYIYDPGRNTVYSHNIRLNWRTPLSKFPLLGWTNLTLSYNANYDWRRGQDPITVPATDSTPSYTINFGNMIQNSSVAQANLQLNFVSLYNKVKFLRDVNTRFGPKGRKTNRQQQEKVNFEKQYRVLRASRSVVIHHNLKTSRIVKVVLIDSSGKKHNLKYTVVDQNQLRIRPQKNYVNATVRVEALRPKQESIFSIIKDYTLRSMMFLQSVSMTYKINGGSLINGFMPEARIFGMNKIQNTWAPGWRYIAGFEDENFLDYAASHGWITTDTLFNQPINFTHSEEFRMRISLSPFNNVRIDLNFQRDFSFQTSKYGYALPTGEFHRLNMIKTGNFFISTNMIKTAFEKYDPVAFKSDAYNKFLFYRKIIADRLANYRKQIDPNYSGTLLQDTITGEYYPQGYSLYAQDVLIPALLAAYTGFDPTKVELTNFPTIPLPDWRINFDGLSNLPFIKKFVNKITLTHSYAATYTVNNFQSNPNFDFDTYEQYGYSDVVYQNTGDFIPVYEISAVSLSERFIPFLGLNMQFKNKMSFRMDYKRTRDIFLSFSNSQIRERHSNAFTLGAGYIIPNVRLNINTPSGPQTLKSDLNLRLDLTYEHTYEIYRRIIEQISQLNIERKNLILSITGDYNINDKVSVQLYYNHNVMETNTAPKTLNLEGGFRVRVVLTQ